MNSEKAKDVKEELVRLFGSSGTVLEPTKSVVRAGPQDVSSEVYEFRSQGGESYLVTFKTLKGEVSIVVQPPVGTLIIAETPAQINFFLLKVMAHLDLEGKALDLAKPGRKTPEKVLA